MIADSLSWIEGNKEVYLQQRPSSFDDRLLICWSSKLKKNPPGTGYALQTKGNVPSIRHRSKAEKQSVLQFC